MCVLVLELQAYPCSLLILNLSLQYYICRNNNFLQSKGISSFSFHLATTCFTREFNLSSAVWKINKIFPSQQEQNDFCWGNTYVFYYNFNLPGLLPYISKYSNKTEGCNIKNTGRTEFCDMRSTSFDMRGGTETRYVN